MHKVKTRCKWGQRLSLSLRTCVCEKERERESELWSDTDGVCVRLDHLLLCSDYCEAQCVFKWLIYRMCGLCVLSR